MFLETAGLTDPHSVYTYIYWSLWSVVYEVVYDCGCVYTITDTKQSGRCSIAFKCRDIPLTRII